eukprot:455581_1
MAHVANESKSEMSFYQIQTHDDSQTQIELNARSCTPVISKTALLKMHQNTLSNNKYYNESNEHELVQIFGGIGNLLSLTLASDDISLTENQLQNIYDVISNNNMQTKICKQTTITEDDNPQELTYHFSRNDTYLHAVFGDECGQKICDMLYSKCFGVCVAIVLIIVITISLLRKQTPSKDLQALCSIFIIFFNTIIVAVVIFSLLSINRTCFKLLLTTFEFWFKSFYALQFAAANWIYIYNTEARNTVMDKSWYNLLDETVSTLLVVLTVWFFGSFDGLQYKDSVRCVLSAIISLLFILDALFIKLHTYGNNDDSIMEIKSIGVSMLLLMADSLQILGIFIGKQALLSIFKKDRCIVVNYAPYFKWIDTDNTDMHQLENNCNESERLNDENDSSSVP